MDGHRKLVIRVTQEEHKMQVYIATRLERHLQHNLVRDALARFGVGCSYDWTTHGPVFREGIPRIREVAKAEIDGVLQADAVVVLLPGGRGTHAELGAALAAKKPVIVHSFCAETDFGNGSDACAFYHHPLVRHACYRGEDWVEKLAAFVSRIIQVHVVGVNDLSTLPGWGNSTEKR
jgi:hypothetical protein